MAFNLQLLGDKLKRYRNQFQFSIEEVSADTGIGKERLTSYEEGNAKPTGDEILILSDFYKCDYKFFISNEKLAPFEQTETLFRRFGEDFSKEDRWAVQEFLFLAECESFLESALNKPAKELFSLHNVGNNHKTQAENAATALRTFLGYSDNEIRLDIYKDFRRIGIHVFRRKLNNSNISGLFVNHPLAGKCILINYSEDIYRQRFTAAHEAGHTILDADEDFIVSFTKSKQQIETRANIFASRYLMPQHFLRSISSSTVWNATSAVKWASELKVSTQALAYALKQANLIDSQTVGLITRVKVPKKQKRDPEIPETLSLHSKARKEKLLSQGLSNYYVNLCFEAYRENLISASRLSEMLLLDTDSDLRELTELYGEKLQYGT